MSTQPTTRATFKNDVLNADKPVLVDFTASWCPPCKMLKPVLEQVSEDLAESLSVAVVDVDAEQELASQFQVSSIPSLKLFADGNLIAETTGFKDRSALIDWITSHTEQAKTA